VINRLFANWVYGGFLAGILLLALVPLLARGWSPALTATYLCLPIYMIHQYEEHDRDRFRIFVNQAMGGAEILTPAAVFVINIVGVWCVIGTAIYLAAFLRPGLGLIAAYLLLVNAAVHVVQAFLLHRYNPGLATAIVLFFPVGGYCVYAVATAGDGAASMQAIGAAAGVGIHVVIVAHAFRRKSLLARAPGAP
jgi:hypothetical protein